MFATWIKPATTITLIALTCNGVGLTRYSSTQAGQPALFVPTLPDGQEPRLSDKVDANKPAEKVFDENLAEKMFPDGVSHDFGILQRGTQAYHAFRVVNTSALPLKIVRVRAPMGICTAVRSTKSVLQPNEEGKIEVFVDTRTFVGPKSRTLFVTFENGMKWTEARLFIQSESRDDLTLSPREKADHQNAKTFEEKIFPEGLSRDFGTIQRGTQAYHAFRVVNTFDSPLHIATVRGS